MPNGGNGSGAPPWDGRYKGDRFENEAGIWEWTGYSWVPAIGAAVSGPGPSDALPVDPVKATAIRERWKDYRSRGGHLDLADWLRSGQPDPLIREPDDEAPPPPGDEPPPPGEGDFTGELAAAVEAWKAQIREMGEMERAEAMRTGFRRAGHAERGAREAWLGSGGAAGEFEQRYAGAEEAGARSLNDLIQQLNLGEQRQLAGAERFGIGTMISAETLEQRQQAMMQQAGQYQTTLAEQIRQFNQAQAQQAGQWGQQFGLSEQSLAAQIAQWQRQQGLQTQQIQAGYWGDIASLFGTLGGAAIGTYFGGPVGTAAGAAVGSGVGGWFG